VIKYGKYIFDFPFSVTCELCGIRPTTDPHHKLSQTKLYRRVYKEFIDHRDNVIWTCRACHNTAPKWSEYKFCKHFGIEPRTTSGIDEWERREK
jgi:hypothetical protein